MREPSHKRKRIWIVAGLVAVAIIFFLVTSLTKPPATPLEFLSSARRIDLRIDMLDARGITQTYSEHHTYILDQPRQEVVEAVKRELSGTKWTKLRQHEDNLDYLSNEGRLHITFSSPSGPANVHYWGHRTPTLMDRVQVWWHGFMMKGRRK